MKERSGVIVAGLALFSMFFGAGDLIWPMILGGWSGDKNLYAMLGLLITGVSLPLLGLMAMMLFQGNYRAFFGQIGRVPGFLLILVIQAILGPLGSVPRLITLSYATLKPYLGTSMSLALFSILFAAIVFVLTIKRNKIVTLIGLILAPVLLVSLGAILVMGFIDPPAAEVIAMSTKQAFYSGLNVGYNTLDLIASFIFAPLVLAYFVGSGSMDDETPAARRQIFKKMVKACLLAAFLLSGMYVGLTYVASYYTPLLPPHAPEERLGALALYLLGPYGALFSCVAVALICLTTAIPINVITADFIQKDLLRGKANIIVCTCIALAISTLMSNIGFMGIANFLSPILNILCPGLILLSALSIMHKLYEMRMRRSPVFAAFALSTVGYLIKFVR